MRPARNNVSPRSPGFRSRTVDRNQRARRFDGRTFTHYLTDANNTSRLSPGPQRVVAQDSHGRLDGNLRWQPDRLDGQRVKHFRHDTKNSDSPANDKIGLRSDTVGGCG
jgi:hypothetical protein